MKRVGRMCGQRDGRLNGKEYSIDHRASTSRCMMSSNVVLPAWARVSDKRLAHIMRVTELLDRWARELDLSPDEASEWHDVGRWHDAMRDADEDELRHWAGEPSWPVTVLHGPAAARRLASEGETRQDVLDAIRWHTLGNPAWARTGRALYMADFLEPGRPFARAEREFLARTLPRDFDGVFRQVVQLRLEWTLQGGEADLPRNGGVVERDTLKRLIVAGAALLVLVIAWSGGVAAGSSHPAPSTSSCPTACASRWKC